MQKGVIQGIKAGKTARKTLAIRIPPGPKIAPIPIPASPNVTGVSSSTKGTKAGTDITAGKTEAVAPMLLQSVNAKFTRSVKLTQNFRLTQGFKLRHRFQSVWNNQRSRKCEEKASATKKELGLNVGKDFDRTKSWNCGKALKILYVLAVLMLCWASIMQTGVVMAAPADPGHTAETISTGQFESGNYTFPDSLFIKEYFNVSNLLWVDPVTSRVGIGTTSPAAMLEVKSTGTPLLYLNVSDANTGITDMLTLEHVNASGTVSAGIGSGILFRTIDSASDVENVSMISGILENTANGTERGALLFYTGYGNEDGIINNLSSSETMRLDTEGLRVNGNLTVTGATLLGSMSFDGNATFTDSVNITEDLEAGGALFVNGRYGNVGVGTMSPLHKLTIGSGTHNLAFEGATGVPYQGLGYDSTLDGGNGGLIFKSNIASTDFTNNQMVILRVSGNVGIGTTSPGALLETVGGDVNITNGSNVGIYFDSSENNVGIGTTAPGANLQVKSSVTSGNADIFSVANSAGEHFLFRYNEDSDYWNLRMSGVARPIAFSMGSTEAMRITDTGNVGIGTTSPGALLETVGGDVNITNGSNVGIYFDSSENNVGIGTTAPGANLQVKSSVTSGNADIFSVANSAGEHFLFRYNEDSDYWNLRMSGVARPIAFSMGSTEAMRITDTGNVGIGTTAPSALLDVAGSQVLGSSLAANLSGVLYVNESNVGIGTTNPGTQFDVYGTNAFIRAQITSGTSMPHLRLGPLAGVAARVQSYDSINDAYRTLDFDASNITWSISNSQKMAMDSNGNVGIGTTSPNQTLDVYGNVQAWGYITTSKRENKVDIRLKDSSDFDMSNISLYKYKKKNNETVSDEEYVGLMADEVPSDCRKGDGIDLYCLLALDTIKVKELKQENNLLKSELCRKEGTYSWCPPAKASQQIMPAEQPVERPVEQAPVANSAPASDSYSPDAKAVVLDVGGSQEFTIISSDADNDELSIQWYVDNMPVAKQTSSSFNFTAEKSGSIEVKVLVTDGKDYSTHQWVVMVNEGRMAQQGFGVTGGVVGVGRGVGRVVEWVRRLF